MQRALSLPTDEFTPHLQFSTTATLLAQVVSWRLDTVTITRWLTSSDEIFDEY